MLILISASQAPCGTLASPKAAGAVCGAPRPAVFGRAGAQGGTKRDLHCDSSWHVLCSARQPVNTIALVGTGGWRKQPVSPRKTA